MSRRTSFAGVSLGPSDLVSQSAGSTVKEVNSGSALWPESYPRSILWNIEDCQHYGLVTEKNMSRPPMEKCVRNTQGEIISTSEYNAIKATAQMLVNIHLVTLGTPTDPAMRVKMKMKTYYKKYFLQNFKDINETVIFPFTKTPPTLNFKLLLANHRAPLSRRLIDNTRHHPSAIHISLLPSITSQKASIAIPGRHGDTIVPQMSFSVNARVTPTLLGILQNAVIVS